jgi:DMSO/TMAO reductase YedYZ molybdopterin-dependent catalytic subunit
MLDLSRRDVVLKGTSALAAYALFHASRSDAFPSRAGETVIPWADQPPPLDDPTVVTQLVWEEMDGFITPNDKFFGVTHLEWPEVDASTWALEIDGLVRTPMKLTLDDLKARARQDVAFTLECSGNHGFPVFTGGIGTAVWGGTPLAPILEEAGVLAEGIEVVFWGHDKGKIELHDAIRDVSMTQHFARSMSLADAMGAANILAYEMNGEALPAVHGFPARLIAPGWYGIANVKWLKRIEVRERRFVNQFMGRDYVTIREEEKDGETVWTETSVGRVNLKSAPARVTRDGDSHRIVGAAWGGPIARVEVKIDDGAWQEATIDRSEEAPYAWRPWYLDWPSPTPGEHTVTSRAIDTAGNVQPAMDDP